MSSDSMFIYHFLDPNLSVAMFFEKRGQLNKWASIMQLRFKHLLYIVLEVEENFMLSLPTFLFFEDKHL